MDYRCDVELPEPLFSKITTPVKPVMERMMCCCGGELKRTKDAVTITTYPPQYTHKCNKCGILRQFYDIYPRITYEEAQQDGEV